MRHSPFTRSHTHLQKRTQVSALEQQLNDLGSDVAARDAQIEEQKMELARHGSEAGMPRCEGM